MSLSKKIKVRIHTASFNDDIMHTPYYFINIKNNYKRRHIVVEGIWFFIEQWSTTHKRYVINSPVTVINDDRPLPVMVKPQTEWETWIKVHNVHPASEKTAFVRLNNGKYLISSKRKGVAPSGLVPGGNETKN